MNCGTCHSNGLDEAEEATEEGIEEAGVLISTLLFKPYSHVM